MQNLRPHLYLILVNLFYGIGFTVSKMLMPEYLRPFGFVFIRASVATLLFFILHQLWIKEKIKKNDWLLLMACGLFGVAINQGMFFWGLSITTPINASLIMIITPILVFLISFMLAHEKATWQKILGLLLGAGGAIIIIGGKGFSFSGKTVLGDFFVLINATSYAVYLVIVRPLMKKYHPLTVIKWVFFFGWFPVAAFGFKQFSQIEWHHFTWQAWLGMSFIVICVTFFAYLLNILALREVHSSVVGAYIYLQPILATIISVSIGQDHLSMEKVWSAVLICCGVFLVSFSDRIRMFNRPDKEPDTNDILLE